MRFIFSEAELCTVNENNKKIMHDGLVKHCVYLLQSSGSSKTPKDSSITKKKNVSATKNSHCSLKNAKHSHNGHQAI